MKLNRIAALGVAAGVAVTGLAAAPAAHAEPVAPSFAIVGSDTLQDVVNALTNGTSISGAKVRSTAGDQNMGSFDATGSAYIQTKSFGPRFGRPNGSGDGVKALSRSIDGAPYTSGTPGGPVNVNILNQVDIARSSSGPSATDPNGALEYIPFGRDALAYAYTGGNTALANLTVQQLTDLFTCVNTSPNGVAVTPVIPQAGSGTRKDFLKRINVTEDQVKAAACVKVGQEHDTKALEDGSQFPDNGLTPMSAAQWVAQNTGAGIDRRGAGVQIGSPVPGVSPVNGTGTAMTPNAAYYSNSTWGRDIYIVVESARITPGTSRYDAKLADAVSTAAAKLGNVQSTLPSQAGSVKKKFGFLAPSSTTHLRAPLSA